ncbi:hypothetical protein [Comamonas sp. JC664]|uniref:hypothetical protein n=1 Tax=Comamonas sp. JC664 TaxID=2801917 RepID=UPI001749485F|nr:hypothetical protein [Comamonas sp. JC664]MBL0694124.1 hypothetical protein [Comamonas sp. JC664]GHG75924.1 hypothetical protein GCM10012319_24540 [Comamonas sp. KCTC 72670]
MDSQNARPGTVTLRLRNSLDASRIVFLEPWTDEYELKPGQTCDIVAEGDLSFPLEVEVDAERIVVYCFDSKGAYMRVLSINGKSVPP